MALSGALESAHRLGVLHRDVKPQNVLFDRLGTPKLMDFGIASVPGAYQTRTSAVSLTLAHAAPEITAGGRATVASDVYALGSTLWTAAAGKAPFVREGEDTLIPLLARIAASPVPPLPAATSHRSCPRCSPSRWPRTPPVGRHRRRSSAPGWRTCSARPARPSTVPAVLTPSTRSGVPAGVAPVADASEQTLSRGAVVGAASPLPADDDGGASGPPAPGPRRADGLPAALRLQRARHDRPAAPRFRRSSGGRASLPPGTSSAAAGKAAPKSAASPSVHRSSSSSARPSADGSSTAQQQTPVSHGGTSQIARTGTVFNPAPTVVQTQPSHLSASHSSAAPVVSPLSHPSSSSTATATPSSSATSSQQLTHDVTLTDAHAGPRASQARRRDVPRVVVEG